MNLTIDELAKLTNAEVVSGTQPATTVTGFADLMAATRGDVSFFGNSKYLAQVRTTQAGAVFVPQDFDEDIEGTKLVVDNPSVAFAQAVDQLSPPEATWEPGVHASAHVDASASIDPSACVDAGAIIGPEVEIGSGTFIGSNVSLGRGVRIGSDCRVHPNAAVREHCVLANRVILQPGAVIGSDGFGFEPVDGRHQKIEQRGMVQIDDDVEVGANSTIDRARFGRTWIQEGTKIDNLVQIGHNARIGKHCIIVALTGIAGSAIIGDYVIIAAQSGVAGHLEIGSNVTLTARSGVTKSIPGDQIYSGYPALPLKKARKMIVLQRKLDEMYSRIGELEKRQSS